MDKYYVTYISSTDDDCCTIWVNANSVAEAKSEARSEYWDIKEIINVRKAG